MSGPLRNEVPSITIFRRERFSLSLIRFDHVNLTAVTDEYLDGKDIKQVLVWEIDQSKVKVGWVVDLTDHVAPIRLSPTIVDDIIP